jgi:pantothenate kinase
MNIDQAIAQAHELASGGERRILGVAGCPGAGKSTLVGRIAEVFGPERCLVVPMDGFHLDNDVLVAHGTRDRKGAPATFDGYGYVNLLRRLRGKRRDEVIYAPTYDRSRSLSVAGAIEVSSDIPLVLTEGNYLLLDDGPWTQVRSLLDVAWYVGVDDDLRLQRLIARHVANGKSPDEAEEWVMRSDEANARLVVASAHRADATVEI